MNDIVHHPPHYKSGVIEVIDVIEQFELGFHLGNTVKYVLRAGRKGSALTDLQKARWYIDREIARQVVGIVRAVDPLDLTQYPLVYLATPYSKFIGGITAAFHEAARLAAALLASGVKVYSPIAHTHPLAVNGNLDPLDHTIWMPFDEAMMEATAVLLVAKMEGWDASIGIAHEIEFFKQAGKPVLYLDPKTMIVSAGSNKPDSSNVFEFVIPYGGGAG